MKKLLVLVMACMMLLSGSALADDLAVQIIGGDNAAMDTVSLDDMQLGTEYMIEGYAKVTPQRYMVTDFFAQFNKDAVYAEYDDRDSPNSSFVYVDRVNNDWYYNWRYRHASWKDSGVNADFAWFEVDITNMQKTSVCFMEDVTVKVIYDDEYELAGWVRQINKDYLMGAKEVVRYQAEQDGPLTIVLDPANEEAQDMLYTGTYVFGCTLPNSVVEDKDAPLRMEIKLGDNELTYHIRK